MTEQHLQLKKKGQLLCLQTTSLDPVPGAHHGSMTIVVPNHPEAINEVTLGQQAVEPADRAGGKPVCEGLERGTEYSRNTEFSLTILKPRILVIIIVDVFVVAFFRFHVSFRECHYKEFIYANMRRSSTSNWRHVKFFFWPFLPNPLSAVSMWSKWMAVRETNVGNFEWNRCFLWG